MKNDEPSPQNLGVAATKAWWQHPSRISLDLQTLHHIEQKQLQYLCSILGSKANS